MASSGVNHTLVVPLADDADYSEVLGAVDEDFSAACTLFEHSASIQDRTKFDQYVCLMHDAMDGTIGVKVAADRILELAI
jgi:hypothetical protein